MKKAKKPRSYTDEFKQQLVLQIPRSTYYYETNQKPDDNILNIKIRELSRKSRNNYDIRKIKVKLAKKNLIISRRRIGRIVKEERLVSAYTMTQYKPHVNKCNESIVENVVNRKFSNQSSTMW